jgi:hypothetical protein
MSFENMSRDEQRSRVHPLGSSTGLGHKERTFRQSVAMLGSGWLKEELNALQLASLAPSVAAAEAVCVSHHHHHHWPRIDHAALRLFGFHYMHVLINALALAGTM